jgi:hypothetical protein
MIGLPWPFEEFMMPDRLAIQRQGLDSTPSPTGASVILASRHSDFISIAGGSLGFLTPFELNETVKAV